MTLEQMQINIKKRWTMTYTSHHTQTYHKMDFRLKCQSFTIKWLANKLGKDFWDRMQKSLPFKEKMINGTLYKHKTFIYFFYQKMPLRKWKFKPQTWRKTWISYTFICVCVCKELLQINYIKAQTID